MATPQSKSPTPTTLSGQPALGGGSSPALSGSGRITLTRNRDAWTYYCNPMILTCLRGHIVPELAKAFHTPGLNGNGRGPSEGQGWGANLMGEGYVQIPHNFVTTAFGKPGGDPNYSTYCVRHEMKDAAGRVLFVYHEEVWRRPRVIGNRTIWIGSECFDEEGRLDFLRRCLEYVSPGGLDPAQIEVATAPLIRDIREAMKRGDPRAIAHAKGRIEAIPAEHIPGDIIAWAKKVLPAD